MQNIIFTSIFHPRCINHQDTWARKQDIKGPFRKKSHGIPTKRFRGFLGSMRWNFFTPRSQTCHLAAASGVPKVSKAWPQLASRCSNKSWQETRVQRSHVARCGCGGSWDSTLFCCYNGDELRWRNWTRPNLVYSDCSDEDALTWFSWFLGACTKFGVHLACSELLMAQ